MILSSYNFLLFLKVFSGLLLVSIAFRSCQKENFELATLLIQQPATAHSVTRFMSEVAILLASFVYEVIGKFILP